MSYGLSIKNNNNEYIIDGQNPTFAVVSSFSKSIQGSTTYSSTYPYMTNYTDDWRRTILYTETQPTIPQIPMSNPVLNSEIPALPKLILTKCTSAYVFATHLRSYGGYASILLLTSGLPKVSGSYPNIPVNFLLLYDLTNPAVTSDNSTYGLKVFSSSNSLVYDSRIKVANLVDIISLSTPSVASTTNYSNIQTINHAPCTNPYYFVQGPDYIDNTYWNRKAWSAMVGIKSINNSSCSIAFGSGFTISYNYQPPGPYYTGDTSYAIPPCSLKILVFDYLY